MGELEVVNGTTYVQESFGIGILDGRGQGATIGHSGMLTCLEPA